jgi:hypothetical protein
METPAREGWEIAALARDLGMAHELGGYRHGYEARRSGRRQAGRIFCYDEGLAQVIDGESGPRVIRWSGLGPVLKYYTGPGEAEPALEKITISGADGTVITASSRTGWHSLLRLEQDLDPQTLAARLPAATADCQRGTPVAFGGLSVSADGLAWDGGQACWRDIRSVRVRPEEIQLNLRARPRHQRIGLAGVPDSCAAVRLIQDLAAQHRIPLTGTAAAVLPPAAGEPAAGATGRLLTEGEVGQVLGWPVTARASTGPVRVRLVFQGGGASITVMLRRFRAPDRVVARLAGRAQPGAGDEAWWIGRRTLAMRAGATQAVLTAMNLPPETCEPALTQLARILADRLAGASGEA